MCVFIRAFRHQAEALKPPRTLITRHILGRTIGAPGDIEGQRAVVRSALELLETVEEPGTVVESTHKYRAVRGQREA